MCELTWLSVPTHSTDIWPPLERGEVKLGFVAHGTEEAEAGGSGFQGQPRLTGPCLKQKMTRTRESLPSSES